MEPCEGKMAETTSSTTVSTKLERIAKLAKQMPGTALRTLAHHIDIEWLHEAHRRVRKDGALGVDGQTAEEYAKNLETNSCSEVADAAVTMTPRTGSVASRFKSGSSRRTPESDSSSTR